MLAYKSFNSTLNFSIEFLIFDSSQLFYLRFLRVAHLLTIQTQARAFLAVVMLLSILKFHQFVTSEHFLSLLTTTVSELRKSVFELTEKLTDLITIKFLLSPYNGKGETFTVLYVITDNEYGFIHIVTKSHRLLLR